MDDILNINFDYVFILFQFSFKVHNGRVDGIVGLHWASFSLR